MAALKVFELTRCWKDPRGRYLIAATSKTEAAKLLGCSLYHLSTYSYVLDADHPEYKTAMSKPKTPFKTMDDRTPFQPL
ncbi:hypothetical protein J4N45_10415 [Vibrio sp. SCSIO 43140]|uniref:hypothetical protein n=1 Tax=Vibrio sp. SCSIO 43140 TaxID=2819100 RepID=UPI002076066F|nr:hypothetical protein [Vibrio sp. SCSIO 43140]USD58943.1 hypothetical protein J4N45_10415 [Vibrio sp. SCSIO 43140]